jgi:hypothetical protein
MRIEQHFKKLNVRRFAIVDSDKRMVTLSVATDLDGKALFTNFAPLRMLYECHFIYDLTDGETVKSRWSDKNEDNEAVANLINRCGIDYGLVEF